MVVFTVFAALAAFLWILSILLFLADSLEEAECAAFLGLIFCVLMTCSTPFISAPAKENPAKEIPAHTPTIKPYTFVAEPLVWIEKETSESLEP